MLLPLQPSRSLSAQLSILLWDVYVVSELIELLVQKAHQYKWSNAFVVVCFPLCPVANVVLGLQAEPWVLIALFMATVLITAMFLSYIHSS